MDIRVRQGVFETNSSSTHSVTVDPREAVDFQLPKETLRRGVIDLRPGGYGWGWMRYRTPTGKMEYLLAQVCARILNDQKPGADCTEAVLENANVRLMADAVKKAVGCDIRVFAPKEKGSVYIDGDSQGNGYELFCDRKTMTDFLFSQASYVETGNDNRSPGEFIDNDLGGLEEFYPAAYAATDDVPDGVRFTVELEENMRDFVLTRDGESCRARFGWGEAGGLVAALGGAVIRDAIVYVGDEGSRDAGRIARGHVFDLIHGFAQYAPTGSALASRSMKVTLAESLEKNPDSYNRVAYRLSLVAPPETADAAFVAAWQAPKSEAAAP